jgi:hypothetical protein
MKKLFFTGMLAALLSGCGHQVTYPVIPTLEFKSLVFGNIGNATGDKIVTLTATFTDGDGDIGYYQDKPNGAIFDSTYSPYYYNFVIELQVFRNGTWKDTAIINEMDPSNDDTLFYNEASSNRLPYLTQTGQNKGLKGDIEKTNFLPYLVGDTIRFKAFIYDRAQHKSNEIVTPGYFVHNP